MKIARFKHEGKTQWGLVEQERILPLPDALNFGQALAAARGGQRGAALALNQIRWLPPVESDTKIICVGLNYRKHAQEVSRDSGGHPSVFPRFPDSFVGHGEPVIAPNNSDSFDYEAELAVVIGDAARHVDEANAMRHVAGYTCLAENSVRDYQQHNRQATPGKNFERSGAIGPWIVTTDEMIGLDQVRVAGRLNGERMQHAALDELVFSIPGLIAYLSAFTTLRPGDIIATGTPEGVGMSQKPPRYLRPGDRFEVDITGVGVLENAVAAEEV